MSTVLDRPETRSSRQLAGYGLGALGAVLFSTKSIAIKLAYAEGVDAQTLLALRMVISLPFYLAIGAVALRARRREGAAAIEPALAGRAALVGVLGYWFASYVDFMGLEHISAQFERLILFTYPLFTVVFGALFFGQRVRPRALLAFVFSYAGLALLFAGATATGPDLYRGTGLVLMAAVAFALYQLLAKQVIARTGPRLFTCIAMSSAGAVAIGQFLVTHPSAALLVPPRAAASAVFLAIGATVVPSFLLNAALHRISAQANAVIGTLSPLATIGLAALILGETMSGTDWLGAALVIAGVGWFTLADRR
ncbi:MAG: EamA family transporter [Alphaproteobacteria bacterium]|nr:EamA family transporter [Alphaproteobacteria bacterium]